jgi:hypothetical protein
MAGLTREQREAKRTEGREETGRATRIGLGVSRSKLAVQERSGYKRRWVNDAEGRLQQATAGGYQFAEDQSLQIGSPDVDNVNRDLGSRISRVVDKTTGQKAYLMEIKEEFYKEDQDDKARELDKVDEQLKRGALHQSEHKYIPGTEGGERGKSLIKIETR